MSKCAFNTFAAINAENGSPGFYETYKLLNKLSLEEELSDDLNNLLMELNDDISKIASEFLLMKQR